MATPTVTYLGVVGSAQNKTGQTSTVVTLTSAVSVGDILVVCIAADNSGATGGAAYSSGTITDSKGNTWGSSAGTGATRDPGLTNEGVDSAIAYAYVTNAMIIGDTITVPWLQSTTAKAISVIAFRGTPAFTAATEWFENTNSNVGTAPSVAGTTDTIVPGDIIVGMVGVEGPTGDSFTQDADSDGGDTWHTVTRIGTTGSTDDTNITLNAAYKIVASNAAVTYNPTLGTSRDFSALLEHIRPEFATGIRGTQKLQGTSLTDATSYATASHTPAANKLQLLFVSNGNTGGAVTAPTASGNGLTWVQIATQQNGNHRTTLFRAMGGSPTAGATTIDFAGVTQHNCGWIILEFTGMDTSGTNGSGAIRQSNTGTGTGSPATVTLASTPIDGNATLGVMTQNSTTGVVTEGFPFRRFGSHSTVTTPSVKRAAEWDPFAQTNPVQFGTGAVDWAMVAVEITAPVQSATSSFSGTGSFSATASVARPGTASFSGTGSFAATAKQTFTASASFSGTGSFAATGVRQHNASASFAGVGSFSATGIAYNEFQYPEALVYLETEPDVWVNISDDLRNGYINRGRQKELDRYQAGTASIELSNEDRRYDPTHTGSDLYGYVKPGRRLKIEAFYNGNYYSEFVGKIDGVQEHSNGPNDAVAIISATDLFKDLNKAELPSSAYVLEVMADAPIHWWRLGEPSDTTIAYDSGSQPVHAEVNGDVSFGEQGLVSRDSDTAMSSDSNTENLIVDKAGSISGTGDFTIEFLVKADAVAAYGDVLSKEYDDVYLYIDDDDIEFYVGANLLDTVSPVVSTTPKHVAVTFKNSTGEQKIFVNGSLIVSDIDAANIGRNLVASEMYLGGGSAGSVVTLDEIAIYDSILPDARIAAHAEAMSTPWDMDLPGDRLERLFDYLGIPEDQRDIEVGDTVLQSADLGGSVLEHAYKVAESEFGFLYITKDGKIKFEDKHSALNPASLGTISDQPDADLVYRDSTPQFDDTLIRNEVTVSRNEGVAQTVEDAASIAEYGRYSYTLEGLLHDNDDLSRNAAEFILSEYKDPERRITDLTMGPPPSGKEADMYPVMLGVELTDRITVTEHPQGVGDPIVQVSVVEGIQQNFGPKYWVTKLQLSPAFAGAFWQIGIAGFSEIGETTRVYF